MIRSFNFSALVFSLAVLSLSLAACVRPQSQNVSSRSTFVIDSVKGSSTVSRQLRGFSIPSARLYNFSACLKDKRTAESIKRHAFIVLGGTKEIHQRTDDSGCLNWSEEIAYNHLADERYIRLDRKITSSRMQSGTRDVRLAINPWGFSGGSDVVDLSKSEVPEEYLSDESEMMRVSSPKRVHVSKLTIDNSPRRSAQRLSRSLRVHLSPSILLRDLRGQQIEYALKNADLKASVDLIASSVSGSQEKSQIVSRADDLPVYKEGDGFRFDFTPEISQGSVGTRFRLAVKIAASGGPKDLTPFSGLFSIGDYASLTGSPSLPVQIINPEFEREEKSQPNVSGSPDAPSAAAPRLFEVGELKLEWAGVEDESALVRTVNYRVVACLTDTSNGNRPAVDADFVVTSGEGNLKKTIKPLPRRGPGSDGCYSWEDSLSHRYYEPEHFRLIPVTISHPESGFSESRTIAINPWDRLSLGGDSKFISATVERVNNAPKKSARLMSETYSWDTINTRHYSVDEFMNLKIKKSVQFRMPLRVLRHSSILHGRSAAPEALRDGIYLFRALIFVTVRSASGEKTELFSQMDGDSKLIRVVGGEVKVGLDFDISDPKLIRSRANFVYEILPVDESRLSEREKGSLQLERGRRALDLVDRASGLVTPTYVAPIWAGDEAENSASFPTDMTISGSYKSIDMAENTRAIAGQTYSQILERARKSHFEYVQRMREMTKLTSYLKVMNLEYVALNNESTILAQNPGLEANNIGLPAKASAQRLLAFLNYKFPTHIWDPFALKEPVTLAQVQEWIDGKRQIDVPLAGRLCMMFMYDIQAAALQRPKGMMQDCMRAVSRGDQVFSVDRTLRLLETDGGTFLPSQRPTLSLNVGSDVSFGRSNSHSNSFTASWSPTAIVGSLVEEVPILSAIWGAVGLSASFSHSRSDATSVSEGSSLSSGTSLIMEHVEMKVKATRYDSCVAIRISPEYWEARKSLVRDSKLKGAELLGRLSRGVLICSGGDLKKPIEVREHFYTFAQGSIDGMLLDKGDLGNYPWLLSLRGTNDYVTFLNVIAAKKSSAGEVSGKIDVGGYPLERLSEAYARYRGHLSSQPGVYAFEPQRPPEGQESGSWWKRIFH